MVLLSVISVSYTHLERHLADLEQDIAAFGLERSRIESDTDERCTTYLSESQARLDVILADKQIAQNEAEVYRRELDSAQNDLAALEARAAELSAKLTAAQNSVGELIDACLLYTSYCGPERISTFTGGKSDCSERG